MLFTAPALAQGGLAQREWAVTATAIVAAAWLAFAVWAIIRSARIRVQAEMAQAWGLRLRGLLKTAPGAYLVVSSDGGASCSDHLRTWFSLDRKISRLDDLVGTNGSGLAAADFEALSSAVEALALSGATFTLTLKTAAGDRILIADGKPAPPGLAGARGTVVWFTDVTEEHRQLAALESERDRLAEAVAATTAMIDAAPIPIWRRGADQKLVQVNRAYVEAVEADTAANAIRLGSELFSNPLSIAPRVAARAALDSGNLQVREEAAIIGGERRMIRVFDQPLPGGEVAGFALDVSDRDEALADLQRFVTSQTATLDRLSAGVARFGSDRALVFWNKAFAAMFRLEAAFLDEVPEFDRLFERMRETRRLPEQRNFPSWRQERRAWFTATLDGAEETWVLPDSTVLRVIAQPTPDGGLLLIFEDRSEQLQLASARDTLLRVQEATLNNLHEAVGVFAGDGRIQLYNRVFVDLWQLDHAHLISKPHVDALVAPDAPPHDAHKQIGLLRELIQTSTVDREPHTGRLNLYDGRILQYSAVPLPDGNALFTFLDVTDTTRIETALRDRNEALEAADKQKTAFVENMSYELRTPLTTISGFGEMLAEGYAGDLTEKQLEYIHAILVSSERLQLMINDILDLAVTEAGALALDIEDVDVNALVASVGAMIEGPAEARDIKLTVDTPANAGMIAGDHLRLKQALYNLASNAVRFTPPGGEIAIGLLAEKDMITATVRDTGIGIPEDEIDLVFERFRQGSNAKTGQGVGLGLSLVHDVIALHGGRVAIESELGKGTTVRLIIPRGAATT